MNRDVKVLSKVLVNQIQQYTKRATQHDQMKFIPGVEGWSNTCKSLHVIHHTIISRDAEKASDKIQHPFVLKTLNKSAIEGVYLIIIETIFGKPTASIIFNGEAAKCPPEIRHNTKTPTLATFIQHSIGSASQSS